MHIDVQGHADARGPESYNKKLSADRARAVLEYMVKHGVAESRLSSQGFGSSRPLVEKNSEHAWFLNRRVEFKVTRQVKQVVHESAKPEKPDAKPEKPEAKPDGAGAKPEGGKK